MATPTHKNRDISHEINVLKNILELPITNIKFDDTHSYVYLYIKNIEIGTVGFVEGLMLDYYPIEEQRIPWHKIYQEFREVIDKKIEELNPSVTKITIGTYKKMYVRSKDTEIVKVAFCNYRDDQWLITLLD